MENKTIIAVAVAVLLVVLSKLKSFLSAKPKLNLPPGPWTLPVIGSLHHLGTNPLIYRTMSVLAHKYGPLMLFQLGEIPLLVVSSPEAAQEVMKTHDTLFADRWANPTLATFTYNKTDLVFSPYGERWRQLRKIFVLELLSATRVRSFRSIRDEEVTRFVRNVAASAAMDLSQEISRFMNDTFARECVGSRCRQQDEYLLALHEAIHQTSGLSIADLFPSSRVMRMLGSTPRKALECRDRIQHILEQIIQEKKKEAMDHDDKSILGVLLRLQKENSTAITLTNDTIVALMFVRIIIFREPSTSFPPAASSIWPPAGADV
jgi:cytochrome P450